LSLPVLALLAPASIFGVLARLGLLSLGTYDGQAIFPLAYIQAAGCLMMGLGLGLKESLGRLSVHFQTLSTSYLSFSFQLWSLVHRNDYR
jgi:fluoride exporter